MDRDQMRERCPGAELIGKASLKGFRLIFDKLSPCWNFGVADIIEDSESRVWGLLYRVTEKDLDELDIYEGYPDFYRRFKVMVEDESVQKHEAETYKVVKREQRTPPSRGYLKILKKVAKRYKFPEHYRSFLKSIKTK
jgi:gamma-glutamylcyclotransferase